MPTEAAQRENSQTPFVPAEKLISLAVAMKFQGDVLIQRVGRGEEVGLHRMIDHQVHRHWPDESAAGRRPAARWAAHRRQIDQAGHAGKVLQDHASRLEGHFDRRACGGLPAAKAVTACSVVSTPSQFRSTASKRMRMQ